jgi:hypothetical protein
MIYIKKMLKACSLVFQRNICKWIMARNHVRHQHERGFGFKSGSNGSNMGKKMIEETDELFAEISDR